MAQERVESIQEVSYEVLRSLAAHIIDFESHDEWSNRPNALDQDAIENGARFGTVFNGQSVRGQRTDSDTIPPLALLPLSPFSDTDIVAAFNKPDGYRRISGYIRRSPFLPLVIGGHGRQPSNMLSGFVSPANSKVLTSLSPRLQLHTDGSWDDNSVVGIEPISLLFDEDQTALGITLVDLDRRTQKPFVRDTMYESLVQIKFFRRDGSLISEIDFPLYQTANFAFARCGETVDIAGVQITNSSSFGFAIDDITFGLPTTDVLADASDGPLAKPLESTTSDNPLQVDLCSFYTS